MHSKTSNSDQQTAEERTRAKRRAHYIANRSAIRARQKSYYAANADSIQASSRRYYLAHSEKIKAYQREYNTAHAEKVATHRSAYGKIHRAANRDKINARVNAYRAAHPEKTAARFHAYYDNNRPHIYEVKRRWRKNNPELVRAQAKRMHTKRYKAQPAYRILINLRGRMRDTLNGADKSNRTRTLIGTTPEKLRQHLESLFLPGMSWANYGRTGWHIDHIVPCAAFDLTDPKQQERCFHWSNLRPLWAKANIKKSDKTDGQYQLPLSPIAMEA